MKTQSFILITLLFAMLLLVGCDEAATQPPATKVPPTQAPPPTALAPATQAPASQEVPTGELNAATVLNMVERLNAGDVEGSLAFFAEDAMAYLMGFPPTGIEMYKGKEQIRSLWQDSADNHFEWEVEVTSTDGDLVMVDSKTWHDFTRQLEVAPLEYRDIYQVIDGKIKTYGSWLTEDALARFKPAFAAAMPPEPTATPFSGVPGSELTVTIADGTCTTESPAALKSGEVTVNWIVQDQDKSKYALKLFTLIPGKDLLDLMVATYTRPYGWGEMVLADEMGPGGSKTYPLQLENGPLYVVCWSKPPDLPIGNSGPIPVVP